MKLFILIGFFTTISANAQIIDTGIVVRYYADEAAAGAGPTHLIDSTPSPLNLPLTYGGGNMFYSNVGTGRGLEWTTHQDDGIGTIAIEGTKVDTMMHNTQTATIELVVDVTQGDGPTRLFSIDQTDTSNWGMIGVLYDTPAANTLYFTWMDGEVTYTLDLNAQGRCVLHFVVDTTQAVMADRVRLYLNAVLQVPTGGEYPAQNNKLFIGTDMSMNFGNRSTTEIRSPDGVIYYAALYNIALSAAQVTTNHGVLIADDDTPPGIFPYGLLVA